MISKLLNLEEATRSKHSLLANIDKISKLFDQITLVALLGAHLGVIGGSCREEGLIDVHLRINVIVLHVY